MVVQRCNVRKENIQPAVKHYVHTQLLLSVQISLEQERYAFNFFKILCMIDDVTYHDVESVAI